MPIETLATFVMASALLSLAPGPDNLFVLVQSALYGRKSGVLITLGLCSGLIAHTAAVSLGVAALLQASPLAFDLLKLLGACYLLWLAWQAFRASASSLDAGESYALSAMTLYRRGIIMNITNPKVSIFFLAFLPQFAVPEAGDFALQMLLLGGVFMIVALVIFSIIALLAGSLGEWLRKAPKAQVVLNRIAGMVFLALAIKLTYATVS
ncbi:MAG: LysE family translocator [Pseudomonadales bacterium]|nr:LysE family translocator [Pseudomonadales bacterium]